MNKPTRCAIAAGLLLAMQAPAQSPSLPQTYAFTAASNMMGPMTVTVNRNGSRERIELGGGASGLRLRLLYDFQARRIFTVDLNANTCTTQEYTSPYAPALYDPIGSAEEIAREAGALRTIGRESVNGIAARIVEAPPSEGQGKFRFWLEEKFGFPVKEAMTMGSGPERLIFEMRQLGYAASAAALFVEPAGCVRVGGTSNANGGAAEINIGATAQGRADFGGARPGGGPVQTGGNVLVGKWDFNGKDGAGVAWRGELTITKLQQDGFDPTTYSNECDLNLSAGNAGKGMSGPCLYDAQTRKFSFSGGDSSTKFSFTSVLSPDGKTLTQGHWADAASPNGAWSAAASVAALPRR